MSNEQHTIYFRLKVSIACCSIDADCWEWSLRRFSIVSEWVLEVANISETEDFSFSDKPEINKYTVISELQI